ncbi:hypothetical protein C6A33_01105 [Streptococcus anginosus]|uniref:hypothetical protein n=1 Tax=Streptococcus anginosus TaxID=1328 RepID=UPI000D03E36A|nr:hypothetical protein [Streptococcus anginosus]PRT63872.1 hypothetical protein C6A33_01105 [Streptococcus anginosus]
MKKAFVLGLILFATTTLASCSSNQHSKGKSTVGDSSIETTSSKKKEKLTYSQFESLYPEVRDKGYEETPIEEWAYNDKVRVRGTVLDVMEGSNAKVIVCKNGKYKFLVLILPEYYKYTLKKGDKFISYGFVTDEQAGYPALASFRYFPDFANRN